MTVNKRIKGEANIQDFQSMLEEYGLDETIYESILNDIAEKLNGLNEYEWKDIVLKYGLSISPDTLRKANGTIFGGKAVGDYLKSKEIVSDDFTKQLDAIRKERQKLCDERAALRKISRDTGRIEHDLEYLEKLIKENSYKPSDVNIKVTSSPESSMLVILSDLHYGLDVSGNFGTYNHYVADSRMLDYLREIKEIQKRHGSKNVYVAMLGDLISGGIHHTIQLENRENVIEQIQGVSELIAWFINELSQKFENVYVNGIAGNHSRIGKKDDVMRDERLDDLVIWYLKAKLGELPNVKFTDEYNYDSTLGNIEIYGKEYWFCHGDYDAFSESGISKLVMMVGHKPEAILYGHKHKCSYDDISGVKIIRSGSLSGACDDFVVTKRITGRASQMIIIVDNYGVKTLYPVEL